MMAGAQVVHLVYRPLDDLDRLVKEEVERKLRESKKSGHSS